MKKLLRFALLFLAALGLSVAAENPAPPASPKPQQFIYVLRLVPRLHDDKAWTPADNAVIKAHVAHLKAATDRGQVILAGRTAEPGDKTFGLVIFTAENLAAATAFMNSDPTVAEKIMTASVHPYSIAFKAK